MLLTHGQDRILCYSYNIRGHTTEAHKFRGGRRPDDAWRQELPLIPFDTKNQAPPRRFPSPKKEGVPKRKPSYLFCHHR